LPSPVSPGANPFHFRVPLHDFPDDDGTPRMWASHDRYKASFDDGFAFYPVLGSAYPKNLPLAWRTRTVKVGSQELLDVARPVAHRTDWRLELRRENVTEVYDLRADGLEQSFVIARRPAAEGDLVIEGAITTELRCAPVTTRHGALVFTDESGTPLVRYGEAFAFDALGQKTEVATSFDGETIRLHVSRAWLATASYPVVVDPLTSTSTISNNLSGQETYQPEIGRQSATSSLNLCFAYVRIVTGSDHDLFVAWRTTTTRERRPSTPA
jgi:hypothetical protein